jgi:hypothetical protein
MVGVIGARMKRVNVLLAFNRQAIALGHDIDGIPATSSGFSADRAITTHVGIRGMGNAAEFNLAAITGSFQLHCLLRQSSERSL